MTKSASDNPVILKRMQARAHRGHGAVYKWLYRKHAVVRKGFNRTDATWDSVVESMIADGVTGRGGTLPNSKSVARVWVRVCVDIARARQLRAEERTPLNRSRSGPEWQPRIHPGPAKTAPVEARAVTPEPRTARPLDGPLNEGPRRQPVLQSTQAAPSSSAASNPAKSKLDNLPPDVKAKFDKLRQSFAETDRKRFGTF